jgi:type IV pilus assembly protein PilA
MLARLTKLKEEREEGFTLIELLVVIIIIGILAAIAIPVFLNQRQKGYDAGIKADLRNAATAEETYLTDYNVYTDSTSATTGLGVEGLKLSAGDYTGTPALTIYSNANNGYCISAQSASGKYFEYDSSKGGLQTPQTAAYTAANCGVAGAA